MRRPGRVPERMTHLSLLVALLLAQVGPQDLEARRKQLADLALRSRSGPYFHANSGIDEPTVQSETDRYMAWPAQALG